MILIDGRGDLMLPKTVIREAREDELGAVLALWEEAGVTPPSISDSIGELTLLMQEPGALLLVAAIDGQIVGSVIGGWDGWRGNIYRLAVAPECRRKGIARGLVKEVTSALWEKGAYRISALVEHQHQWATGFWDSLGDLGYERDPKFVRYIADRIGPKAR